jgi:hypothetical protein
VLPPMTGPSMWNTFATRCGNRRAIKPLDQPVDPLQRGDREEEELDRMLPLRCRLFHRYGLYVVGADHSPAA